MSLRFQLALVLSLMLMATLGGFGFAAHWTLSQRSYSQMKSSLAGDANAVAERLLASDVPYAETALAETASAATALADADVASPIESLNPNTLTKTPSFAAVCPIPAASATTALQQRLQDAVNTGEAFPVSDTGFAALLRGQSWSEVAPVAEGSLMQTHMVYSKPVFKANRLVNVAQVAQSIAPIEASLLQFRNWLMLGSGTATLLMFGLTLIVTSQGLRPLAVSLNNLMRELRDAHRHTQAQQEFVADVSHELRAPLTTVRGNLGLLQRQLSDADRQAVLHDAVDEIERMSRLVNQLLMVARTTTPDATAQSFCCEPVPLRSLIQETGRTATRLMQGKTFTVHIPNNASADAAALGNSDALKQVLLILLDNAAKFTPRGEQVSLSLGIAGGWAKLSVQDTGTGISAEDLPHVFERGYRGGTLCAGHGLGLSIARQLIEAQGGQITVTSQVGAGSVFSVLIRLIESE